MIVPWWPMAALAAGQAVDAALCVKPPSVIQDCLNAVRFPRRLWPVIAPTKAASAVGLIIGIWWLPLAIVACVALVVTSCSPWVPICGPATSAATCSAPSDCWRLT